MRVMKSLLIKTKHNLILQHGEDDDMLIDMVAAAISYAEGRQHKEPGHYLRRGSRMLPTTERAIVMLASHLYESRDGSTGGFFNDKVYAGRQVWDTVNNLLTLDKDVVF